MKGISGMNPAIMVLGEAFWPFLLGGAGVLLALPLTALVLVIGKRVLVTAEELEAEAQQLE